ncbi:MAG: hypothetical protein DCO96_12915 [Fluviicola sp. XM-24bin1]|nr:MAG: hypothetical protein DCO96_12915 [Fluviicola sp. XM-24bin1]
MNIKTFFQKNWIHFAIIGLFLIIAAVYFSPQMDDQSLRQHDIEQFHGMVQEVKYHREVEGNEPLWTNSMFGGMPATQIHVEHEGNIANEIRRVVFRLFPAPAGTFILHLICFYVMAIMLRIKPVIATVGAFAFAFASYEMVIMAAGHNTKAMAVAFLPLVLGGFIYSYRRNWKWGALLSALFLALQLSANHVQVTYYMMFLLGALGIYFLVEAIRKKEIKPFLITSVSLVAAYLLALVINVGNLSMTNSYAKHTIRGDNDLTVRADGTENVDEKEGLSLDYITQYSYGRGESMTLLSPYVRGSHSGSIANSDFLEMAEQMVEDEELESRNLDLAKEVSMYWGDQPSTAGPVYVGIVVFFLAFLGLFFIKDHTKWIYLGIALLCLIFSWGSNAMGATEFFVEYLPLYKKFRTVTIALVIIQLIIPFLGILLLQKFYENREELKEKKNLFYIASGIFFVLLLGMKFGGPDRFAPSAKVEDQQMDSYTSRKVQQWEFYERQQPGFIQNQIGVDPNNQEAVIGAADAQAAEAFGAMRKIREQMYSSSTSRTLLFGLLSIGLVALFFFTSMNGMIIAGAIGVVVLLDLVPVDRHYLGEGEDLDGNSRNWILKEEKDWPLTPQASDEALMAQEIQTNPSLQAAVDKGEKLGIARAEREEVEGATKRRIIDSYRFRALSAATHYRVFDYQDGWNGTRAAYYHKALSGYHAAKLRRIQNAFEFHIMNSNNEFFNMMNVKYFIQGGQAQDLRANPGALGVGWAIKDVKAVDTPDDEIRALGKTFEIKLRGPGRLLVNGNPVKSQVVYGTENLVYLVSPGDSIPFRIQNNIEKGMTSVFVQDKGQGRTGFVPEITLEADTLNSFIQLASITCTDDFKAKEKVIVSKDIAKDLAKSYSGEAEVTLDKYAANKMEYSVNAKGKQFIVFSEIYYPDGWTATIDGKEVDIHRVNYLLRGLEVSGGKHKVVFEYAPAEFKRSNTIAFIGSTLLVLLFLGFAGWNFMQQRKNKQTAVEVK